MTPPRRSDEPELWRAFCRRGSIDILLALAPVAQMQSKDLTVSNPAVSRQVFIERLKEFMELGFIERNVEAGPPIRSFYSLTNRGRELAEAAKILDRLAG